MRRRLVIVSGTGTGIGKTHVSQALLRALTPRWSRVTGIKPVETGLGQASASDASLLDRASSFHVQHSGFFFAEPISPHLAARAAGRPIDVDAVVSEIDAIRATADVTLVELPGGLFTPLTDTSVNAALARALAPDVMVLVAPDRLGVLHDVIAVHRAADSVPLEIHVVALVAPERADASTGRNADEIVRLLSPLMLARIARADIDDLALAPDVLGIADLLAP